jgi:hypothetical protein
MTAGRVRSGICALARAERVGSPPCGCSAIGTWGSAMHKMLAITTLTFALGCHPYGHVSNALAGTVVTEGPVELHNGPNAVDILGDGTPGEVFVAWRGNFNAHGHSTVAFYVRTVSDLDDSIPDWQIVPAFGPQYGESGRELLGTTEGADCTLGDLRVIQHRGAPVDLIVARRDLGASYADPAATHFDYYRLARNVEGAVGRPPYYFSFVRTVDARRQYCDVNVAFDQELHLGRHGIGHGEAAETRRPETF